MGAIDNTELQRGGTSERESARGPDATHYSSFRTEQIRSTMVPVSVEGSLNSSPWLAEQDDNMILRQSQTQRMGSKENTQISYHGVSPDTDDREHTGMRRGKRSIGGDGIWLKGSYPSKRARWEGPSMATPTPNPEQFGHRIQRPSAPVPSQPGHWYSTQRLSSSNALSGFQSIPRIIPQSSNQESLHTSHVATPISSNPPINIQPLTLPGWTPDFQPLYSNILSQDRDLPSEPPVRIRPRSDSQYNEKDIFHQFLESPVKREDSPNNSLSFFQQYKTPRSIAYPEDNQSTGRYTLPLSTMPRPRATRNSTDARDSSMTEVLPPLPPSVTKPYGTQPMINEETSFVTETAASSQNLSEFQYRKRRPKKKKTKSQVLASNHLEQRPVLIVKQSLGITEGSGLDDMTADIKAAGDVVIDRDGLEKKNIVTEIYKAGELEKQVVEEEGRSEEKYEEEENVLASCPIALWYAQSSAKNPPSSEEDKESEESSNDLDIMDSEKKVRNSPHSPSRDISGHVSSGSNSPTISCPKVVVSVPEEDAPNDQAPTSQSRSSRSPASQSLPKSEQPIGSRNLSAPPHENAKVEASRCIYDFSTQSFNTTPQRSALPMLSQDSSVHFQTDERKPPEEESEEENEKESDEGDHESDHDTTEQARSKGLIVPAGMVHKFVSPKSLLQDSSNPDAMIQCRLSTSSCTPDPLSSQAEAIETPKSGSISSISKDEDEDDYTETRATPEAAVVEQLPPKTPEPVSQVLPPEQQTPWAVASTAPIPVDSTPNILKATNPVDADFYTREGSETFEQSGLGDSSWQHIERPTTPENDEIRPFNDLMTPPPRSRATSPQSSQREPQNTQDFIEAATRNPWETLKRKPRKSGKRVSFGIPEENEEESEQVKSRDFRRYSPPPLKPIELWEDETLPDGTIVTGFKKHFSAIRSALRKPRKVILEDPITASSPSVGAMAEAFVTADREAPTEPSWETSRHLKPRKEATTNVIRQDDSEAPEDSIFSLDSPTRSKGDGFQTDFDMEDVLGEAADFLGEWSVEADLQKARELKRVSEVEDTGAKRRSLYGIT